MGCKTIIEQLNEALGKDTVNTTDTLPIVENSTLYRVTVGDLALSLGLTGSLTSEVTGGAVPVLSGVAPDYKIRGLNGANGITVQQNIYGNITISQNIGNAGTAGSGQSIVKSTTGERIDFKRVKAGAGITVTSEANSVVITNDLATQGLTNIVVVSDLTDLPAAVVGVITLSDNTLYQFVNSVSTSNRFVMGADTTIAANDLFNATLTYTGTGVMFTTTNGRQGIKEIGLSCPNGTLLDSTGNTTGNIYLRSLYIEEVKNLGTVEKPFIGFFDSIIALHTGQGFQYGTASNARLKLNNVNILNTTDASSVFIDLASATFNSLNLSAVYFSTTTAGQTFLKGAASGGNISGINIGFVTDVIINGDMASLNTITANDAGWDFSNCNKIPDTDPHAVIYLSTSPATTVIAAASTPVVVTGTFTESLAQIYDTTAAGRVTYKGRRNKFVRLDLTMSFEPAGGTNKVLTVQFFKNGTVLSETTVVRTASSGAAAVVSVDWGVSLSQDDYIEVAVGNNTDTTDVVVNQMLLRAA